MTVERLTAEDELMLWPDEVWPQDIGAVAILDGRPLLDPEGRFRIDDVRRAVAARLHLVPRFRQLLRVPPKRLGGPFWVDARAFDIRQHVRLLPLPANPGEEDLLHAVELIRRRRLDRSRPLWEMWFLTGLPAARVGLFVRLHHCIADGMAGVATIASFLDATPGVTPAAAPAWTPAPSPSDAELLADREAGALRRREAAISRLRHPLATGGRLLEAVPALTELLADRPLPPTSLDRRVGHGRRLALVRTTLDSVKTAASAAGTVNDVLLAAVAGGLRTLLKSRRERVEGTVLRVYVPVSLHAGPHSEARGNLIAQMVVPLPAWIVDPAARLRRIAVETARRKAKVRPPLGLLPHSGLLGRTVLKLIARQRVNVATADIPGPVSPLYFAGAEVLEVFPMVQILGNNTLAVGAISYRGQFNLMAVADEDAYPDLAVFKGGLERELQALEAAPEAPAPAPPRRSGRGHIRVRDVSLFTEISGRGYPLLVMHGGPSADLYAMLPFRELADEFAVILYDHRCNGRSTGPPVESMTFENLTADADALRELLGFERWAVLGHSFGGEVALEYALRFPDRVSHLVLLDAAGDSWWARENSARVVAERGWSQEKARLVWRWFNGEFKPWEWWRLILQIGDAYQYEPGFRELLRSMSHGGWHTRPRAEALIFSGRDLLKSWTVMDRLGEISVPTLVMAGRQDFVNPPEHQRALAAGIPGAQLRFVERAGHNPHDERPAEVLEAVREFLSGTGSRENIAAWESKAGSPAPAESPSFESRPEIQPAPLASTAPSSAGRSTRSAPSRASGTGPATS